MNETRCRHDFADGDICSKCDEARPTPVMHSIRCLCAACCAARRGEAAARKEELAGKYPAFLERTSGPVYARMGAPKPMPGTLRAIAKRYGRAS